MREFNFAEGEMLLVDKPVGWTSFDVVNKIRNALKPAKLKVGHAGTLDPLASGLLIICTGKLTKQIDTYQAEDKTYTGTMVLGACTPSYDMETEISGRWDTTGLTPGEMMAAAGMLTGELEQLPPAHSAIKVGGERLYEKARRGEAVELKRRKVHVSEFRLTKTELPEVDFMIKCSKGTYIRSLVHDFGKSLNNGAYLKTLVRTQSGAYKLEDAWQLKDLLAMIKENKGLAMHSDGKN